MLEPMQTWLKCAIALSMAAALYLTGVITAGWSPQWAPASEAHSADNGHRGGTFCPSDSRLTEIFQAELQSTIERIKRRTVNSCEYGWAMIHVAIIRRDRTDSCLILLRYEWEAKQWYAVDMNWLESTSVGDGVEV